MNKKKGGHFRGRWILRGYSQDVMRVLGKRLSAVSSDYPGVKGSLQPHFGDDPYSGSVSLSLWYRHSEKEHGDRPVEPGVIKAEPRLAVLKASEANKLGYLAIVIAREDFDIDFLRSELGELVYMLTPVHSKKK